MTQVQDLLQRLAPELRGWQRIANGRSLVVVVSTVAWILLAIAGRRWADHWSASLVAFLALAILQHRLNIIHHEAIHRLLFSHRLLNDLIGHHVCGAAILTPATYRLYHFKHHRELGREEDPDFPGYTRFPASRWGVIRFLLANLLGLGVVSRFLAETRSAIHPAPDRRAYHETRGWRVALRAWGAVAVVQVGLAAAFVLSGGSPGEFGVFWVLPEVTLTRTLMAIRLMGEHTSRGEGYPNETRYLVTLSCPWWERLLFAPLGFNYHAEHHLFPAVPWHRLGALHQRLRSLPDYRQLVEIRPGYLHAIVHRCICSL